MLQTTSQLSVQCLLQHKADVKDDSIGKLPDAASAAWRRQLKLHGVPRANGAVARRSRLLF